MKVALMTYHNALNYGAALQVYATQQAIQGFGIECEVLDYVNEHRKNAYSMGHHVNESLRKKDLKSAIKYGAGSFFMNQRRIKFKDFYSKNLKCTKNLYTLKKELKGLNNNYSKFIIGSDQVWNYVNNGQDFSYFLDFVNDNNKKISYASSFGMTTIPEEFQESYKNSLQEIKHLSTRESYGVSLIKELTGRDAELVLDPVFLLDKARWKSLYKAKSNKEKYVFCYTNRMSQFENFTSQTGYSLEGKKVHKLTRHITIKDFLDSNVKVAYSISPIRFIETIANAELVVSASFHCIAMSILLNVPFVAILTGNRGKDERILNILRITGLEDRIFNDNMTIEDVNAPIDYEMVEKKVQLHRKNSLDYLKNAILSK
ncbi:polysaccharide pyruvyl transferase family protein [Sutcliffiella horikoshii]|uniref:polysaccharide pyruvyl transferase family protein n=1 Tax=Sutcliffiella horikoshii TaxID=79883 RepID=UPI00384FEA1C